MARRPQGAKATTESEGGTISQNKEDYWAALFRKERWMDHTTASMCGQILEKDIVVWEWNDDRWNSTDYIKGAKEGSADEKWRKDSLALLLIEGHFCTIRRDRGKGLPKQLRVKGDIHGAQYRGSGCEEGYNDTMKSDDGCPATQPRCYDEHESKSWEEFHQWAKLRRRGLDGVDFMGDECPFRQDNQPAPNNQFPEGKRTEDKDNHPNDKHDSARPDAESVHDDSLSATQDDYDPAHGGSAAQIELQEVRITKRQDDGTGAQAGLYDLNDQGRQSRPAYRGGVVEREETSSRARRRGRGPVHFTFCNTDGRKNAWSFLFGTAAPGAASAALEANMDEGEIRKVTARPWRELGLRQCHHWDLSDRHAGRAQARLQAGGGRTMRAVGDALHDH